LFQQVVISVAVAINSTVPYSLFTHILTLTALDVVVVSVGDVKGIFHL